VDATPALTHGVRRTYQHGCHCEVCRAANTAYQASYRAAARAGRRVLGAHVAAADVARAVASLVDEGYTRAQIAVALGCRCRRLQVPRSAGAAVALRTRIRVLRLLHQWTT
jgi:hypothetical protein